MLHPWGHRGGNNLLIKQEQITHMSILKYGTNEPIYEAGRDSQTYRTDLGFPRKPQDF